VALLKWRTGNWNQALGHVGERHVVTLEWDVEGHWRVRGHVLDPGLKTGKHMTLERAKDAAETWWAATLADYGAQPKEAPVTPENLTSLVEQVRELVLKRERADYGAYKARVHDALAYMDQVVTPNLITLEHITRILKGEK
jgi:hypothetical protein